MNTEKTAIRAIAGAARCPEYSPSMVKALMKKLETNEKAFALLMNVTPSTVRLWMTVSKIADAAGALEERRPKADGTKQSANRGK